jgi:hypothetical protein
LHIYVVQDPRHSRPSSRSTRQFVPAVPVLAEEANTRSHHRASLTCVYGREPTPPGEWRKHETDGMHNDAFLTLARDRPALEHQ